MLPKIGLTESQLNKAATILTTVLADEMLLYIKTRKYHWNVSGESFMELHQLFEAQYTELEKLIDEVAERINKLGSQTIGSMQEFIAQSRLKDDVKYPAQKAMLKNLLDDHEALIVYLRKDVDVVTEKIKDVVTADFLTGLMEKHETIAWKLRRYLK